MQARTDKIPDGIWAKKGEREGRFYWLPLKQHLEDTKNVTEFLWDRWLCEGQKSLIARSINVLEKECDNAIIAKKTALFLAAIHDLGKCSPAFCTKKGFGNSPDLEYAILEKLQQSGFLEMDNFNNTDANRSPHTVAGQYLLHNFNVCDDIASIVGAHHGKPVDHIWEYENDSYLGQGAYLKNYYQDDDCSSEIFKKWDNAHRVIFDWALKVSGFESEDDLPSLGLSAQIQLLGILTMADWIASNEKYFPLIGIDMNDVENGFLRANGYFKWEKSNIWKPGEINNPIQIYENRFNFKPRNMQKIMAEIVMKTENPGFFILEAPMGLGKTEAALVAAEELAAKTRRSGIFFGLPTQATSNGIFQRIADWIDNLEKENKNCNANTSSMDYFLEGDGDYEIKQKSIRLCHGKAYLNEKFLSFASSINVDDIENQGENASAIIVNQWFSGKKTAALDDFVIGTVDQLLMMALKQNHLALRHLGFSKKVVIIDEVHAYDAYMSQYLKMALQWLGFYQVPVILLSATLPAATRKALVETYQIGKSKSFNNNQNTDNYRDVIKDLELVNNNYPAITYSDGAEIKQEVNFINEKDKIIEIKKIDDNNLMQLLKDLRGKGGVIGIIVNTVKRAQTLGDKLLKYFGEQNVEIFHSAFLATDRVKKEENLIRAIGKNGDRPNFKIIIGTQVLEQSLDIDFDVMITDIAPMDLLLQRIGRLQRHEIERLDCYKNPKLYVLGISEDFKFDLGSSVVYGDYLLASTQYYLPEIIKIPSDISNLVQKVYGNNDEELLNEGKISEELKERYKSFKGEHDSKIKSLEIKANAYRLQRPLKDSKKASLIGWLEKRIPNDSEETASATVRDIEDSIEVIAVKKIGSGYGFLCAAEDISKEVSDKNIARELAKNTFTLPKILSKSYNIDDTIHKLEEYNIKNLKEWQNSFWLKGAMGIIFDENLEFEIGSIKLKYDAILGILYDVKGSDSFE